MVWIGRKKNETVFFGDYLQLDLIMFNSDPVDANLKPGCPNSILSMPPAVWLCFVPCTSN